MAKRRKHLTPAHKKAISAGLKKAARKRKSCKKKGKRR